MENAIVRVAVPTPLQRSFDYTLTKIASSVLLPGSRVWVPFGRRKLVGVVLETVPQSQIAADKLRNILEVIDHQPLLSNSLFKLLQWASHYYQYPIGEVMHQALPVLLRQGQVQALRSPEIPPVSEYTAHLSTLNPAQQKAVEQVKSGLDKFTAFLLEGVTGSGKTEVYFHIIDQVLQQGKQALVLVPEIALTPQTVARFTECFNVPVGTLHSGLTDKERLKTWELVKDRSISILIGTRSAIFADFSDLGVIIVDEEHDSSFKQQDSFRYSARDLAVYRAQLDNIPIILGSATPSLESLYNTQNSRYQWLTLPERAGEAIHPSFRLIDMCGQRLTAGLTPLTLDAMRYHLQQGNQVLLFLNRRGFARALLCHECGWVAQCPRCDLPLTFHQQTQQLHCHHCDSRKPLIKICGHCQSPQLQYLGVGTERLEHELATLFADYPIVRIDRDSTRKKNSLQHKLEAIQQGKSQLLIGTQMLAKGHHFPNVTLVVVLNADHGLLSTDFRAAERVGQLLIQVAGRAGRADKPGEVLVQTYQPQNILLTTLVHEGYTKFANQLLGERQAALWPPYSYLALIRAESVKPTVAENFLHTVKQSCLDLSDKVTLLGPEPAPMPKRAGKYREQLLLRATQRKDLSMLLTSLRSLLETMKIAKQVRWSIDVDPQELY